MLPLLIDYAGRLHPLVIHFPIALLLVGAVGEIVRLRRGLFWAAALLVALTAHLGAALVWSTDFFS